jgi:hypothetical protein
MIKLAPINYINQFHGFYSNAGLDPKSGVVPGVDTALYVEDLAIISLFVKLGNLQQRVLNTTRLFIQRSREINNRFTMNVSIEMIQRTLFC